MPTPLQSAVLTLGFKFIPKPIRSSIPSVLNDFELLARRIRLRCLFVAEDTQYTSPMQILLRAPTNANFQPPPASSVIENYITHCRHKLITQLSLLPQQSFVSERRSILDSTIQSLTSLDSIIITQADKNMGPVIVDRDWYEREAFRQLSDPTTYSRLLLPPKVSFLRNNLDKILLKHNNYVDPRVSEFVLRPFDKYNHDDPIPCAYFYMLIKLHKPEPTPISGRPIVASIRSLTYNASKYLDKFLQPLMTRFHSYLKNTFDIIEILESQSFPQETVILTGDVNSLYPSIDIKDGLNAIAAALKLFTSLSTEAIDFVSDLLEWVLINNFISFGDTYWLQIKGTAMGTPVAVTFANIYLSMLEFELSTSVRAQVDSPLVLSSILMYKRYIDDIIALFISLEQAQLYAKQFNLLRPDNIKVDFIISTSNGVILDISLFKGSRFQESGHFDITLFQKSCNKYLYIPPFSFHPAPIFRGFINSELQRIRLHCTSDTDFLTNQNNFHTHLVYRGYYTSFLDDIFPCRLTRNEIFEKRKLQKYVKRNKAISTSTPLVFVTDFTPLQKSLDMKSILDLNDHLSLDPLAFMIFSNRRPITAFRTAASLKDKLTKSRYPFSVKDKFDSFYRNLT